MSKSHTPQPLSRVLICLAAGLLFLGGAVPGLAEEKPTAPIEKVGQIPVLYPGGFPGPSFQNDSQAMGNVAIILNPARRRAYELFKLIEPARIGIRAFDLDTLKPLGPGKLGTPGYGEIAGSLDPGDVSLPLFTYALTDRGGTLFVRLNQTKLAQVDLTALDRGQEDFATLKDLEVEITSLIHYRDYHSGQDKLLVTSAGGIQRIDASSLQAEWALERPPLCPRFSSPPALWRSSIGNFLYLVCTESSGGGAKIVRMPADPRNNDVPNSNGTEAFPIIPNTELLAVALIDSAVDRVSLVSSDPRGGKGVSIWVFDGPGEGIVGNATFLQYNSALWSAGIDQASGRLYAFASDYATSSSSSRSKPGPRRGGLYLFDNRLTPITQGLQFPELSYPSAGRIGVDPASGQREQRIVVRRGSGGSNHECYKYPHVQKQSDNTGAGGCPIDHFFTVYADRVPIPRPFVPADLDSNTQGVKEVQGLTDRTFEASGGAYGIRARVVGGLRGATPEGINDQLYNDFGKVDYTNQGFGPSDELHQPNRFPAPACYASDREAASAQVEEAVVSEHEATATARSLQADSATKEDQRAPTSRCRSMITPYQVPPPNVAESQEISTTATVESPDYSAVDRRTESPWSVPDASCSGDQDQTTGFKTVREVPAEVNEEPPGGDEDNEADNLKAFEDQDPHRADLPADHPGYGAQVSCRHEEDAADAGAQATPVQVGVAGELTVTESTSDVKIARLAKGGVKVVSSAQAKGIRIGDVYIEAVRSEAISIAKGRAGTATTTFSRTICGVSLGGGAPSPCYSSVQDPTCLSKAVTHHPQVEAYAKNLRPDDPRARPPFQAADDTRKTPDGICEDPLRGLIVLINARLAGTTETNFLTGTTAEFRLREPEPALAAGTPGGYLAGVQKREAQVINDSLLMRDFTREIPGLELTIYRDSDRYGVGRQVIQLAGVRATTSYGTLCLPPLEPQGGECKQGESFDFGGGPIGGVLPEPPAPAPIPEPLPPAPDFDGAPANPTPTIQTPTVTPPAPSVPRTPIGKARAFLVRSFSEGIVGTGVWFALGLPVYLATRRFTLTRAFPKT